MDTIVGHLPPNSTVAQIVDYYREHGWTVIEILQEVQRQHHYLSRDSLEQVARYTGVPLSRVYSIATFYKAFSLKPLGRHHVCVCLGTSCHVSGGQRVLERLEEELGIKVGETTPDREFSLASVRCVGACSLAPVVVEGENTYGLVGPDGVKTIIARLKGQAPAPAAAEPPGVIEAAESEGANAP